MQDYRDAKCIELHDSNIALTTDEEAYEYTCPIGRTDHANKPAFRINLGDISMLFRMLGYNLEREVMVPGESDQSVAITSRFNDINDVEIPIFKAHYDQSATDFPETVKRLECQVLTDRLVNIKVTSTADENEFHHEICYSGSFTIWWKDR